jgi:hypothetical protein
MAMLKAGEKKRSRMDAALLDEHEAQKILRHFYFIAVRGRGTSLLVNRFWKLGLTMSNARSMGFDALRRRLRDEEVVDAAGHLLLRIIQVHAFFFWHTVYAALTQLLRSIQVYAFV